MPLTVRLDTTIEAALERHCAERGLTKSAVVQRSLSEYLWRDSTVGKRQGPPREVSATFVAFARAGVIGAGELGGASATKAAVRERATRRIRRSTASRS